MIIESMCVLLQKVSVTTELLHGSRVPGKIVALPRGTVPPIIAENVFNVIIFNNCLIPVYKWCT